MRGLPLHHRLPIEDLTGNCRVSRSQKGTGNVGYINKIASLTAIPNDRKWFTGKFLLEEHAKHRAINACSAHAGSIGIEDANGIYGKPIHLVPVKNRLLTLKLTEGVRVPWRDGVIFTGGRSCKPVTRGRGSIDKLFGARSASRFQDTHGTLHIRLHVLNRLFNRWDDVANACKMKYILGILK